MLPTAACSNLRKVYQALIRLSMRLWLALLNAIRLNEQKSISLQLSCVTEAEVPHQETSYELSSGKWEGGRA